MQNTYGFLILLLSLFLGNAVATIVPVMIPGPIWGMGIFLVGLLSKAIPRETVDAVCDSLLFHMNLFFAPGTVNLIVVYPTIRGQVLKLILVTVLSTLLVMIAAGHTAQFLLRRQEANYE
ncbi:MAG: CidA/LrgA family protein [Peptoniphilus sp.]|nr:CidA/LrgA family protein [Peptoniphilus sp.]MDD7362878.1 CidA/LrgA family protein [Bacillota bacterium]MDY6044881.1 CidA/LrgA family protein [Peptoniphilus sp.]